MNSAKRDISNLSRETIQQYHSTKDELLKHEIEKNALENDFDTDALEGWNTLSTSGYTMKNLDKKFIPRNYSAIWGGALGIVILLTGIYLTLQSDTNYPKKISSQIAENSSIKVEETDLVIPSSIEEMVELPKKEQIAIKTIINDFKQQKSDNTAQVEPEKIVEVNKLPIAPIENEEVKVTSLQKESLVGKEIYLYNMKLLDYRIYRSKPKIASKQMILTGTPANIGETSDVEETTEWKTVDIPYIEYIDKTMEIFSKGNNKKALARFQLILETYPDDVNANFYAGLCYYNLKEFSSAVKAFALCDDTKFTNFNEEAEWYTAKSYLANGQKSEAKIVFTQIMNSNGYYSSQAKKIVSSL